ncbi:hypothetical protein EON80_01900, partial [bacterium]
MRRHFRLLSLLFLASASQRPTQAAPQFLDDEAERSCNISFGLQKGATGQFSLSFDSQDVKNGYLLKATPSGASFVLLKNGVARNLA